MRCVVVGLFNAHALASNQRSYHKIQEQFPALTHILEAEAVLTDPIHDARQWSWLGFSTYVVKFASFWQDILTGWSASDIHGLGGTFI